MIIQGSDGQDYTVRLEQTADTYEVLRNADVHVGAFELDSHGHLYFVGRFTGQITEAVLASIIDRFIAKRTTKKGKREQFIEAVTSRPSGDAKSDRQHRWRGLETLRRYLLEIVASAAPRLDVEASTHEGASLLTLHTGEQFDVLFTKDGNYIIQHAPNRKVIPVVNLAAHPIWNTLSLASFLQSVANSLRDTFKEVEEDAGAIDSVAESRTS